VNMCMYDSFFLRLGNLNTGWPVIGQLIVISLPQGTALYTRLIADGIEKSAFWFKPRSPSTIFLIVPTAERRVLDPLVPL